MFKRLLIIVGIIIGIIASMYAIAGYIAQNVSYRFSGLNNVTSLLSGDEKFSFNVIIINPTVFKLSISNLKILIFNNNGKLVYEMEPIKKAMVKGTSETEIIVETKFLAFTTVIVDAITNDYDNYSYEVSGKLYGFLPFKYKGNVIEESSLLAA